MAGPVLRTALITGSNRGIGLATARELHARGLRVVMTARREADARAAGVVVDRRGERVIAAELDLAAEASVQRCARELEAAGVAVDVLVNNGAVLFEGGVLTTGSEQFRAAVDVNLLGALWCCRAFVPAMLARGYGRVVNVSSGWGVFAQELRGPAAYAVTKAALNALTLSLSHELGGDVKVNACSPGWVRTRMGGAGAELSVEQGADTIVWLATLPEGGPNGGYFRGRTPSPW